MHVVVLRRDFYEANRWVARSLFDAFERARRQALATIDETAALRSLLPWGPAEVARTRALMGQDWWTYGLPGNETVLSTFLRYSHAQGLASRLWDPRDLFAPECLDQVVV
jgi:4,5-dihydroxyphthalate decarboxylase